MGGGKKEHHARLCIYLIKADQVAARCHDQPHGGRAAAGKASGLMEGPQRHMGAAGSQHGRTWIDR
eukprot:scaffold121281_cov48-Phaeocystis_antarctica.AAC.2